MKKIETLAEYQQLASRTCPDLGTPELNMLHMNLGIVTEIGEFLDPIKKHIAYGKELDVVNLGEELADIAWYVSNKAKMFMPEDKHNNSWNRTDSFEQGVKLYDTMFKSREHDLTDIVIMSNSIIPEDMRKLDDEFYHYGIDNIVVISKICEYFKLDFWQILTNNIAKLQIRYPDKFSNENALNRNLEAERIELEK